MFWLLDCSPVFLLQPGCCDLACYGSTPWKKWTWSGSSVLISGFTGRFCRKLRYRCLQTRQEEPKCRRTQLWGLDPVSKGVSGNSCFAPGSLSPCGCSSWKRILQTCALREATDINVPEQNLASWRVQDRRQMGLETWRAVLKHLEKNRKEIQRGDIRRKDTTKYSSNEIGRMKLVWAR